MSQLCTCIVLTPACCQVIQLSRNYKHCSCTNICLNTSGHWEEQYKACFGFSSFCVHLFVSETFHSLNWQCALTLSGIVKRSRPMKYCSQTLWRLIKTLRIFKGCLGSIIALLSKLWIREFSIRCDLIKGPWSQTEGLYVTLLDTPHSTTTQHESSSWGHVTFSEQRSENSCTCNYNHAFFSVLKSACCVWTLHGVSSFPK